MFWVSDNLSPNRLVGKMITLEMQFGQTVAEYDLNSLQ
jgi:hypothetical protein